MLSMFIKSNERPVTANPSLKETKTYSFAIDIVKTINSVVYRQSASFVKKINDFYRRKDSRAFYYRPT